MAAKNDLKKYLKELTKAELEKEVEKLYSKFKPVQEYYAMELNAEAGQELLKKYKSLLLKEYYPNRKSGMPGEARASVARKIVTDFSKVSVFIQDTIELMLYRVELCVEFTSDYGDIDEAFYTSTENAFEKVAKLIKDNKLVDDYKDRCKRLVAKTENFGWGFYDNLSYIYSQYFE